MCKILPRSLPFVCLSTLERGYCASDDTDILSPSVHHSPSLSITPHHSPSLPITPHHFHHFSSLPITPHHSSSLSITLHHSPSLPFILHHSPSLPITPHHSPSLPFILHHSQILDFGLARATDNEMTGYVATRYWRAPEIMLNWMHYGQQGGLLSTFHTHSSLIPKAGFVFCMTYIHMCHSPVMNIISPCISIASLFLKRDISELPLKGEVKCTV